MRRTLVLAVSVGLLLPGCAVLRDLLATAFTPPTLRFAGVAVRDASLTGLTLDTRWQLDNPNGVGLSIAALDYAVFVDGRRVVAGAPPLGLQVAARGTTELTFPATVRFLELAPALEAVLSRDTATVRVEGTVGLDTPVGRVGVPLAAEQAFELPKLPQVEFGSPRLGQLTLAGATVEFPLSVLNRTSYPLLLQGLSGRVSLGGAELGSLATGPLGGLEGGGRRTLTLPLTVRFLSVGAAAVRVLQGGRATLLFQAQLDTPAGPIPLQLEQVVDVVR